MNEKSAKKLGEVMAFAEVGMATLKRGEAAFKLVLAEDEYHHWYDTYNAQAEGIAKVGSEFGVVNIIATKAEATGGKLSSMRDLYVGDQWNNATELLEWSGFFEGAAIVHWSLVAGVGEELNAATLKELTAQALAEHTHFLEEIKAKLHLVGRTFETANVVTTGFLA